MDYRIGAFSLAAGLSVKTLRYYDEEGILRPSRSDPVTGYRWYDDASLVRAEEVKRLRELDFSMAEIIGILREAQGDEDLVEALQRKAETTDRRMQQLAKLRSELETTLAAAHRPPGPSGSDSLPKAVDLPSQVIASIRFQGRYSEVGPRLRTLFKHFGRVAEGPPMTLLHALEYQEEADLEVCLPITGVEAQPRMDSISIRTLPTVKALDVRYEGPYEEIGRAYRWLWSAMGELGLQAMPPAREIYLKGPGMIFQGNPKRYVTRVVVPVEGV